MNTSLVGGFAVSKVGLGGHYTRMEEGLFEERTAYVEPEVAQRQILVREAIDGGITYFDTTWRNEVEMLWKTLSPEDRDDVWVNGMVLGAFSGSAHFGMTAETYFDRWLDHRIGMVLGGRFDSVMINAIEEAFDEAKCDSLVAHLTTRRDAGDFALLGFSTHNPHLARKLLDRYPDFQIAMVPYNFRNRSFEEAFDGYAGDAAIVAMKPLVWAEYGISFCTVNRLPNFDELFGFAPDLSIHTKALRFIINNPSISVAVCAANSSEQVKGIADAGEGSITEEDIRVLGRYNDIQDMDRGMPVFIGGLLWDNLRMNYFACHNISRVLGIAMPHIALNEPSSRTDLMEYSASLVERLKASDYRKYLEGVEL